MNCVVHLRRSVQNKHVHFTRITAVVFNIYHFGSGLELRWNIRFPPKYTYFPDSVYSRTRLDSIPTWICFQKFMLSNSLTIIVLFSLLIHRIKSHVWKLGQTHPKFNKDMLLFYKTSQEYNSNNVRLLLHNKYTWNYVQICLRKVDYVSNLCKRDLKNSVDLYFQIVLTWFRKLSTKFPNNMGNGIMMKVISNSLNSASVIVVFDSCCVFCLAQFSKSFEIRANSVITYSNRLIHTIWHCSANCSWWISMMTDVALVRQTQISFPELHCLCFLTYPCYCA